MKLELIEEYNPELFSFDILKEHELKGRIQGPRCVHELEELLNQSKTSWATEIDEYISQNQYFFILGK